MPVKLEPELEAIAAGWPALKRFEVARKLARWSRQLHISGRILLRDAAAPRPPARLRPIHSRRQALN